MVYVPKSNFQYHPFHLVSPSPWPLYTGLSVFFLTTSAVLLMHGFELYRYIFFVSLFNLVYSMGLWFRDVVAESTYLGKHTSAVQRGINIGIGLFLLGEAFFFLAIFWAFFHSSISPSVELGAQWPPMGIEGVNPFELPLLNTVILLSSGVTITYAHHSLIQGNRTGALYGTLLTIVLGIVFTGLQAIEYSVSSFTISDSVYGSCFYLGTGFVFGALWIYNILITNKQENVKDSLLINIPGYKPCHFYISKCFIEWFVGFTDAEGNFNIKFTDLSVNTFKYVQFTFQIGLHKDDEQVLNYIRGILNCGHISRSGNKVNYFINDKNSLLNVILPIFEYVNLNSSKYHHFQSFKKAFLLKSGKKHMSPEDKLRLIQYKKDMENMSGGWIPSSINSKINVTKFWLAGFIDGDGSFSTNKYVPRFKLENHVKEIELYNKIKEFIGSGNARISNRTDKEFPTIVLEVNKIGDLKYKLVPLMYDNGAILLKTIKRKDFILWLILVDIYYKGFHTTSKGRYIFDAIKLHINKYRLTTNFYLLKDKKVISIKDIYCLLAELYLIDSPYEIKEGKRYIRNTSKLVSESAKVIVIDSNGNRTVYKSLSGCAKDLNIGRKKIKQYINEGETYNGCKFILG